MLLNRMKANSFPQAIKPFINNNFNIWADSLTEVSKALFDKDSTMKTNLPSKELKLFINKDFIMKTNLVGVVVNNSPCQGRKIVVFSLNSN